MTAFPRNELRGYFHKSLPGNPNPSSGFFPRNEILAQC